MARILVSVTNRARPTRTINILSSESGGASDQRKRRQQFEADTRRVIELTNDRTGAENFGISEMSFSESLKKK
jgi:hypothetical protein